MNKLANSSGIKEGFLVKRGHVVPNWKARWFVLLPDYLLYYKYDGSSKDSSQRGKIQLAGCVITCPGLQFENRPLVIKLQTQTSAEYFLEACSREERDKWATSISTVIQKLQPAKADSAQQLATPTPSLQLHNVNLNQVVDSMYDVHSGIKQSSHTEQGNSYSNCFPGSSVIDWLLSMQLALTRVEALTLASALLEESFLHPKGVKSTEALQSAGLTEKFLDDSTALYSFAEMFKRRKSGKRSISQSAVEMSGKVIKRAFLLKQGHKRKNWKVRLFVLRSEPGYLHYYDPSRDDISPVGGFSLRGCLVSALDDNGIPSGVKGNVQGNLFKIITQSDKHYFIQATTREEKMDWIEAIKQSI